MKSYGEKKLHSKETPSAVLPHGPFFFSAIYKTKLINFCYILRVIQVTIPVYYTFENESRSQL